MSKIVSDGAEVEVCMLALNTIATRREVSPCIAGASYTQGIIMPPEH